jgi:hypothetical protein
MIAFYIEAVDSLNATSRFPAVVNDNGLTRECMIMFGDTNVKNGFGTYHLWLSQKVISKWSSLPNLSNEMFDGTFVYGDRVIYDVTARYAGSPYHQQFTTPNGALCHYKWVFPDDDKFLGATSFNKIHQPGNGPGDDTTIQREQTAYWMARQLGLPWNYRRFVAVYVNGNRRGILMEDAQTPDADVVKQNFPNDSNGFLYKLQPWFEFDAAGKGFNNESWCTLNDYTTIGGEKKLARYRWNYLNRRTPDSANDYTNVFALIDAANTSSSSSYVANMERIVDMEEWMRIFAIEHAVGNWDSFGAQNSQNMYGYKPQNGKWTLMIWDYNIVLGNSGSWGPDGNNLFTYNGSDPVMGEIYANPKFRRTYLRAFKDIINGPMVATNVNPIVDAKFAAFSANGVSVTSPSGIKSWIATMRGSLQTALNNENAEAPFQIANSNFATAQNYVTITGTAPVEIKDLLVNGVAVPVTWSTVTSWSLNVALNAGENNFTISGIDSHGLAVSGASGAVQIMYNGPSLDAPTGHVVINEIMYDAAPGLNYVELFNNSQTTAFDLSVWKLNGKKLSFVFTNGTILPPGAYLLVAENSAACAQSYGGDFQIAGEWIGNLNTIADKLILTKLGAIPADDEIVAKAFYDGVAPWSDLASQSGVSLQLIDSTEDEMRVGNWGAVTTNSPSPAPQWQHVVLTGIATKSTLLIGMTTAGDVYVDDLQLVAGSVPETGFNYLQNGDFESAWTGPWTVAANMTGSSISTNYSHSGSSSLHVVASSGGPRIENAIWENTATLITNATYTLSYWYLPSSDGDALLIRLSGSSPNAGHIYSLSPFAPPPPLTTTATPGAPNSVRATLPTFSPVWLNEVEPDNISGLTDHLGNHSPWVELYNPSTSAANLDALSLSSDYSNLNQWRFPQGTTIDAKAFLVVWLDDAPSRTVPGELHASLTIPASSGSVALSQATGNGAILLDYLNYGQVAADQSFGSVSNGDPEGRRAFASPTPGAANDLTTPSYPLFINEWMASNKNTIADPADGLFSDWFELYNAGNSELDLGGFYLSNSATNKTQFRIPVGNKIAAGGWLLVWADGNTALNSAGAALHVNFKLSKAGETIALFSPDQVNIDTITFGAQNDDISQGRQPDGSAAPFVFFSRPTPGTSNTQASFILVGATTSGNNFVLSWSSEPGTTYVPQFKNDLSDPTWQSLPAMTANGSATTLTMPISGTVFFRIERSP